MADAQEATNTPSVADSGAYSQEQTDQSVIDSIRNPEHSETRPGAEETKREEVQDDVYDEPVGKSEKELAAERKMHEATQKAAELEKRLLALEQPAVQKVEEFDEKSESDRFYEDPVGYTQKITQKAVQATLAHTNAANTKWSSWQSRSDFNVLEPHLTEAVSQFSEMLPTQQDYLTNPKEAQMRFDKVSKAIEAVAISSAGPDVLRQAEANGKAKAQEEHRNQDLAGGIATSGTKVARVTSKKDVSPEDDIRNSIRFASRPGYGS